MSTPASDNRRWALIGPLTIALWIVGIILINHNGPADHASGSEILAWYKSDTDTIVLGGWLFMLGCLGLRDLRRRAPPAPCGRCRNRFPAAGARPRGRRNGRRLR